MHRWATAAALIFTACSATVVTPTPSAPGPTSSAAATTSTSPAAVAITHADLCATPGAPARTAPPPVADEHYGFVQNVTDYSRVWLEADQQLLGMIDGGRIAVSPDARMLAYWWRDPVAPTVVELRVFDLLAGRERTVPSTEDERGNEIAWSCDESALVVAGRKAATASGVRFEAPPPEYTALRRVDLRGAPEVEVARFVNEDVLPLAWNPRVGVLAGVVRVRGVASEYVVLQGTSMKRWPLPSGEVRNDTLEVDPSATAVLALGTTATTPIASSLYRWPIDDGSRIDVRRSPIDHSLLAAQFRPGSREALVVLRANRADGVARLELWSEDRQIALRVVVPDIQGSDTIAVIPRVDGVTYLSMYRFQPGLADVLRVQADGRTEAVPVPPTLPPLGESVILHDRAVSSLRPAALTAVLTRQAAIDGVIRLTDKMKRADRTDAKLMEWRDLLRVGALPYGSDRNAAAPDAPVWAVAVAGDIQAVSGDQRIPLPYGVWFLDAQTGSVVGFQGDARPRYVWPFYWDELLDRGPNPPARTLPAPGRAGDPVDFTLRDPCGYASAPFRDGPQVVWIVDCGPDGNRNARAVLKPMLESQRWVECGSGLATASWTFRDSVITVNEGGGVHPGYLRLTQRARSGSC